ncbi:MAG: gliding motility lipoprotein GldB, partial [Flavobacteriales bacterium]
QELLYEKDAKKISYFFNPGPFTKNFGKDSPSNIGIWLGSRIIEDYAKNSDLSIQEILKEKNIQKLLSSYDPK